MFVYFVYELHYQGLLPFSWIFEYAIYSAKKNGGVVIAQKKYYDWLRNKDDEPGDVFKAYGYESARPSDLAIVKHYEIPDYFDEIIISEAGSRTKGWAHVMTDIYEPMKRWLETVVDEISASGTIEGVILWYPFPGMESVTKKRRIPHIHWDIAPLRGPIYKTAAYLDFMGTNCAKNEAAERYGMFLRELGADDYFASLIFSPRELLSLFLSDEHLGKLKMFDNDFIYEWGIALSPDISHTLAFNNAYMQSEFLEDVKREINADKTLLRSHPGDHFTVRSTFWPGVIDESPDTETFISRCRRVACVASKTAFLAMLWGRCAHVIGAPHTTFVSGAAKTLSAVDSRPAGDEFVSFIALAYFVPMEYFNDPEYLRWRLTKPSEKEIYIKHLTYYLSQMDVKLSELPVAGERNGAVPFLMWLRQPAQFYATPENDIKTNALGFSSSLDTPWDKEELPGRYIWVDGWAHHGSGICQVSVSLDDEKPQYAVYGLPRPGIDAAIPELGTIYVGFGVWLDTSSIGRGTHVLNVKFLAVTGETSGIEKKVTLK